MIGFHGTSTPVAAELLTGTAFKRSHGEGHWLGSGVYFFVPYAGERTPPQVLAERFARGKHGDGADVSVVKADIAEDGMVDLVLDEEMQAFAREVHDRYSDAAVRQVPWSGWHRLDAYVIELMCRELEDAGTRVKSVRAVFDEHPPLYPATAIVADPHIQVAVRDIDAIVGAVRV